ncbi:hypothetical protein [uncultured Thiodictyon sp.]|uniref:hypothetical protein n=1 Tax=uncultured Thiodictyon sp. TaxID=1846217 RepID=UPI0025D4B74E|nr:hypothetical protein [uncultured Thiodictyon sp.]
MDYRTVFDIADAGYKSGWFVSFGLIFVAAGTWLVATRKRLPGGWGKHPTASNLFAFFFLGFAVLWTLGAFFSTYGAYSSLSQARRLHQVSIVEGLVTNFKPMPLTGHAMERFCVSDVCFEYSDYVVVAGFNTTTSHGGPIGEGLPVRISYVGNAIVKLGVAK